MSRRPRRCRPGTDRRVLAMVDAFAGFFKLVTGTDLEPFQQLIVYELFSGPRRLLVIIPRGNGKTTLFAVLALWQLAVGYKPRVSLAASSREQAAIAFDIAGDLMQSTPALAKRLRRLDGYRRLQRIGRSSDAVKVLSSDANRAHGLPDMSLGLVDELHAHRDGRLYEALVTGLGKRPDSQVVTITTVGDDYTGALGTMWDQVLQLPTQEFPDGYGALRIARSEDRKFTALIWALSEHDDLTDPDVLKQANPASFVTREFLAEQIAAPDVHPAAIARYHACVWLAGELDWLPPGAWKKLDYGKRAKIPAGAPVWVGVDMGVLRDHAAVLALGQHPEADHILVPELRTFAAEWGQRVRYEDVRDQIDHFRDKYDVVGVAVDSWGFGAEVERLEDDGVFCVVTAMNNANCVPATSDLYDDILSEQIVHDGDRVLAEHIAAAAVKSTPRGLRLDKGRGRRPNDGATALMLAHREARAQGFEPGLFEIDVI